MTELTSLKNKAEYLLDHELGAFRIRICENKLGVFYGQVFYYTYKTNLLGKISTNNQVQQFKTTVSDIIIFEQMIKWLNEKLHGQYDIFPETIKTN